MCAQLHGDGDDDLVTVNTRLSLRCPLTGSRMRTPARFSEVEGLMSFDLDAFLALAERSRKWQCPHRCVCVWRGGTGGMQG